MALTKALLGWCFLIVWLNSVARCDGWLMQSLTGVRCYPAVGCFPTSYPYTNSAGIPPQSPESIRAVFQLRRRGGVSTEFTLDNLTQRIGNLYVPGENTTILIHGYQESLSISWVTSLANELLQKESMNVICVDWSRGASNILYFQSVANTRVVGALTALMMQDLVGLGGSVSQFHIVGFSLGAHVAGQAGHRLPGIGRITGLDPAGPSFQGTHTLVRLDPGDAEFVDVYHTDAAPSIGLGTSQAMGDVDYYINGGNSQPNCARAIMYQLSSITAGIYSRRVPVVLICSHIRAVYLFESTIRGTCTFPTYRCPNETHVSHSHCQSCTQDGVSCPSMGYNTQEGTGIYRVDTTGTRPYC